MYFRFAKLSASGMCIVLSSVMHVCSINHVILVALVRNGFLPVCQSYDHLLYSDKDCRDVLVSTVRGPHDAADETNKVLPTSKCATTAHAKQSLHWVVTHGHQK